MALLGEVHAWPVGAHDAKEALRVKALIFQRMGYDWRHDQQDPDVSMRGTTERFHQSDARVRIVTAPARGSKSLERVSGLSDVTPIVSRPIRWVGRGHEVTKKPGASESLCSSLSLHLLCWRFS